MVITMDLEHEKRLTEVEARTKSNADRIDAIEDRQDKLDDLVGSVKALAVREEKVETDVREIKQDVKIFAGRSGKLWDSMVDKIILTIVSAIIGFLLANIGL